LKIKFAESAINEILTNLGPCQAHSPRNATHPADCKELLFRENLDRRPTKFANLE